MNRREFLKATAAGASALATSEKAAPRPLPLRATMGVCQYSFAVSPHTRSTLDFLEYCHSLGAGGVQIGLDSIAPDYTAAIRRRTAELGMYFEAIIPLPKNRDTADFEQHVVAAKRAGAVCLRVACLRGRRYEVFSSLADWKHFVAESRARLEAAVPVLDRHKLAAGIENHKDWTADELVALIQHYGSDHLGACIDTGNNISLLDGPMELVQKLAPFAVTTHFKDMAVDGYGDGFLLSEVPLGQGILDLRRVIETIAMARPGAHLTLEMITRDPLKVPCLTDRYWATFPERNGLYLARTLRLVRDRRSSRPLPSVSGLSRAARAKLEEDNVKKCLSYAREKLPLLSSG